MQTSKFKTIPIIVNRIKFGDVVIGDRAEFIIWREQKNFYRNCPCKKCEKGRCPGFTVRTDVITLAVKEGANVLKVNFKPTKKDITRVDTYVMGIFDFMSSPKTIDNAKYPQYTRAIHDFLKVELC